MTTNLLNASETTHEMTHETNVPAGAGGGLVLDLLATAGLAAEVVYDGDAEGCPHCMPQVLSEAA